MKKEQAAAVWYEDDVAIGKVLVMLPAIKTTVACHRGNFIRREYKTEVAVEYYVIASVSIMCL